MNNGGLFILVCQPAQLRFKIRRQTFNTHMKRFVSNQGKSRGSHFEMPFCPWQKYRSSCVDRRDATTLENSSEMFCCVEHSQTLSLTMPTLGLYPKETLALAHQEGCTNTYTVALF